MLVKGATDPRLICISRIHLKDPISFVHMWYLDNICPEWLDCVNICMFISWDCCILSSYNYCGCKIISITVKNISMIIPLVRSWFLMAKVWSILPDLAGKRDSWKITINTLWILYLRAEKWSRYCFFIWYQVFGFGSLALSLWRIFLPALPL